MTSRMPITGFSGPDAPNEEDIYKCVRCGLCSQVCPTYVELGSEPESPRGRLALMKAVTDGRLGMTQTLVGHLDLCLQCRACEAVCPSGVPFGRIMEAARTQIVAHTRLPWKNRLARFVGFRVLLRHVGLLRTLAWCLKFYQRSGVQAMVRGIGLLRPVSALERLEGQLPPLPKFFSPPRNGVIPASGTMQRRVGMLSGCVMPLFYGPVNEATARVLARNGCEVVVPRNQGCCGALASHSGERATARDLARRNIDVFLDAEVEAIVVNSAGCGSAMKEYEELFKEDAVYREKAQRFAAKVRDVNEYLAALPLIPPTRETPLRVTYQDSCHLVHAQRIKEAPRTLLRAIPGVELVEMAGADMCCGAAGVYTLTHQEMSERLLERKMAQAAATQPDVIATANPGCMLQLEIGARRRGLSVRVAHVVELLDEAYE